MSCLQTGSIAKGYKQTEVGVLPTDWIVEPLDNFTSFISYGFTNPMPTVGSGPLMVTARDINNGVIQSSSARCTSLEAYEKYLSPKSKPKLNDILLTKDGTLGRLALVDKEGICINQSVAILRPNKKIVPSFFKHLLESPYYQEKMLEDAGGSTIKHIYITIVNKMLLGVPQSKDEQTAIANALSDVDFLISELEKLIAKKQVIKTATMQQLLTGRTRLPAFALREDGTKKGYKKTELGEIPEDWDICILNDVINSLSSGATPYRGNKDFYKGKNLWITSGELKYGVINDTFEKISDEALKKSNLKIHPQGTFLMAITGLEAAGTRGSCGIVGRPAATNQSCMAIYPNEKLTSNYLFHWYTYNGDELALKYCQGTKQLSYTAGLLKTIPIFLPHNTCEQIAISNILSDMDLEVLKLKTRLNKTRQVKQGMMQELLTGKTRLLKPESK
ncbi:restriction endonuclease subunit S [Vibrio vulnificus]|uniref:restriction endonuclease subunit S n=1 Tax=Vibrio vulnificus TaxID=672 RepID=UPI0005F25A44|nr:restriction endonuclease subunit S [Vibrio vulnificus]